MAIAETKESIARSAKQIQIEKEKARIREERVKRIEKKMKGAKQALLCLRALMEGKLREKNSITVCERALKPIIEEGLKAEAVESRVCSDVL